MKSHPSLKECIIITCLFIAGIITVSFAQKNGKGKHTPNSGKCLITNHRYRLLPTNIPRLQITNYIDYYSILKTENDKIPVHIL